MQIVVVVLITIAMLILGMCGVVVFYGIHFKELLKKHSTFSAQLLNKYPQVSFQYADIHDTLDSLIFPSDF